MCHRWLVDLRCLGDEELDERRKLRRHFGRKRTITTSVCANHVIVIVIVIVDQPCLLNRSTQDFGEGFVLTPVASALDCVEPLLATLAIRRQHLSNPLGIIVADVAQMARHREDELVARTVSRHATQLVLQCLNDSRIRNTIIIGVAGRALKGRNSGG